MNDDIMELASVAATSSAERTEFLDVVEIADEYEYDLSEDDLRKAHELALRAKVFVVDDEGEINSIEVTNVLTHVFGEDAANKWVNDYTAYCMAKGAISVADGAMVGLDVLGAGDTEFRSGFMTCLDIIKKSAKKLQDEHDNPL